MGEVEALRRAAVGLRREWEEPELARAGSWSDVAVWFGSLLMLGPRQLRGVGAFASVVLISRTWAAAHRRHTRAVNDVLGRVVELLAEDLEDRAAMNDALEEQAADLALLRSHTDWHADHDATIEQRFGEVDARVQVLEHAVDEVGVWEAVVDGRKLRVGSRLGYAEAETAVVVLPDAEAEALHAAVMGESFDQAVMARALALVRVAHERRLAAEVADGPVEGEDEPPVAGPPTPYNPRDEHPGV